jgi:hypothetical protein
MAQEFERVQPGDLITANFMNRILGTLETLEARVEALEASGGGGGGEPTPVMITSVEGPTPLRVGDPITVHGVNFAVPASLNEVRIGGVLVTSLGLNSNDVELNFNIPPVGGLSPSGSAVTLQVSNSNGSDSEPLTLRPAQSLPNGFIQVNYTVAPVIPGSGLITANNSYIFTFEITAFANMQGDYTVTPELTPAGGGWSAVILEDEGNQPRPTPVVLTLPGNSQAGATRTLRVRVSIPSGQPNGTNRSLNLNVVENTEGTQVLPGSRVITVQVGQPPQQPQNVVSLALENTEGAASVAGNNVNFSRSSPGGLLMRIDVRENGQDYTVGIALQNPTGWTLNDFSPHSFDVVSLPPGSTSNNPLVIEMTAGTTAASTQMIVSVTRAQPQLSAAFAVNLTVSG